MNTRNPKHNLSGTIDMEIDHPVYGWIPFTASPGDPEEHGRELHALALAGELGAVAEHVLLPHETPEGQLEIERGGMNISRFQLMAALDESGLLESAESVIHGPSVLTVTRLAWTESQSFKRNSPMITVLSNQLNLTDEQVDDLFRLAQTIEA